MSSQTDDEIPTEVLSLFDALPNPVHFFHSDRSLIWANRAMYELLGYEPEELTRIETTDLYVEHSGPDEDRLFAQFLDLGHTKGRVEVARKDGRQIEISFHSTADVLPGVHLSIWESELSATLDTDEFVWPASSAKTNGYLTERETQVVSLLADGAGNAQVAEALGIAEATVQQHADSARERLGAANRVETISRAIAAGFAQPKAPNEIVMLLSESRDRNSSARIAALTYLSPGAVAEEPTLGQLLGSDFLILGEGHPIDSLDDLQTGARSTLLADGSGGVHLDGAVADALGPGFRGHLDTLGRDLLRLVIFPATPGRDGRAVAG